MKRVSLSIVVVAIALVLSVPVFAAPTSLLRLPTADVLNLGQFGLEADLNGTSRLGRAEAGLSHGLMLGVTLPVDDLNSGIKLQSADLRFRALEGTLVTPAVAVGATYDEANGVSPYAVVTKGVLNAKLTAGVRVSGTDLESAALFGGVDLGVFGPLHVVGEYDNGTIRYGAEFRALNARLSAYMDDSQHLSVVGRVVLPF
jgi:hypothetical protein